MNGCPINRETCECCDYEKELLCDYPYRKGMSLEEVNNITTQLASMKKGILFNRR